MTYDFTVPTAVTVIYADAQGSVELPVKFEWSTLDPYSSFDIFSPVRAFHTTRRLPDITPSGGPYVMDGAETSGESFIQFGTVRDHKGQEVFVVVSNGAATGISTGSETHNVVYRDTGGFKPLFLALRGSL